MVLEKEDEMACLVSGCNFLLRAIHHEALMYESGTTTFVPTNGALGLRPFVSSVIDTFSYERHSTKHPLSQTRRPYFPVTPIRMPYRSNTAATYLELYSPLSGSFLQS